MSDFASPPGLSASAHGGGLALYSVAQLRAIESAEHAALPSSFALMARAADALVGCLRTRLGPTDRVLAIAGPGNNGGDALLAAARLAALIGAARVRVWLVAEPQALPADASEARRAARDAGLQIDVIGADAALPDPACLSDTWIVDGLFGIGLRRAPAGIHAAVIDWIEACRVRRSVRVLAIDIPSGLDADTGMASPHAVHADLTVTMIGAKPGLYTGVGRDHVGRVVNAGLDIAPARFTAVGPPTASLLAPAAFVALLPRRTHASHKGSAGSIAVIGGGPGMLGAPVLSARAALYSGAGRVHLVWIDPSAPGYDPLHPELMCHGTDWLAAAPPLDAIVAGPGLGQGGTTQLAWALTQAAPLVVDADGLNQVANDRTLADAVGERRRRGRVTVLTPHPLEAARLLGSRTEDVQADRLAAARALARRYGAIIVLKGSGTIVCTPPEPEGETHVPAINPTGGGALATAGTGDVLAGTLGALLAQGMPAFAAASAAVWLHGRAADRLAASHGTVGLCASELPVAIRAARHALAAEGSQPLK